FIQDGQSIAATSSYTYDALYRLAAATGREHIGQTAFQAGPPNGDNYRDHPFVGAAHPNDLNALRTYSESYEYDPVGNFARLRHVAKSGNWTRGYEYKETSLIETGDDPDVPRKQSNRLSRTTLQPDGSQPTAEPYGYDAHGSIRSMPHLPLMRWNFKDELKATSRQVRNDGVAPETTYYVYDSSGQRVRKVTERPNGIVSAEHRYLGGFEVYRTYSGGSTSSARETLHVMDDKQR